jgi:hypothetical protein
LEAERRKKLPEASPKPPTAIGGARAAGGGEEAARSGLLPLLDRRSTEMEMDHAAAEKARWRFSDGGVTDLLQARSLHGTADINKRVQFHSSLVQRLALEKEMEGHLGCVNAIAWNSKGSLLLSGSDDTRIGIWSYANRELLHDIDTGHSANIFCTKFVPETSDEVIVSGAGDAEV